MSQATGVLESSAHGPSAGYVPAGGTAVRRASRLWPAALIGAILYGSLLPFEFDWSAFHWRNGFGLCGLRLTPAPLEDIVTNLLLYVPVGAALILSARRSTSTPAVRIPFAIAIGATLSLAAEALQTGVAGRVASWTDVALNATGTAFGVAIAAALYGTAGRVMQRLHGRLTEQPFATLGAVLTIGLLLYNLAPFDFVINTEGLHTSFGRARLDVSMGLFTPARDSSINVAIGNVSGAVWFAALGYVLTLGGRASGRCGAVAVGTAIKHGCILAGVVEFMQLFTVSHGFDLVSLVTRMLGVAFGAGCAALTATVWSNSARWPRRALVSPTSMLKNVASPLVGDEHRRMAPPIRGGATLDDRKRLFQRAATGLLVLLAAFQILALLGSSIALDRQPLQTTGMTCVRWLPFESLWHRPASQAGAEVLSFLIAYGVLYATLLVVFRRIHFPGAPIASAVTVTLTAGVAEALRVVTASHPADLTGPVLALIAAFGASRINSVLQLKIEGARPPAADRLSPLNQPPHTTSRSVLMHGPTVP